MAADWLGASRLCGSEMARHLRAVPIDAPMYILDEVAKALLGKPLGHRRAHRDDACRIAAQPAC
mgnify:CR=1 FL=1